MRRATVTELYRDRTGRGFRIRKGQIVPPGLVTDAEWRDGRAGAETRLHPAPAEIRKRKKAAADAEPEAVVEIAPKPDDEES